MGVILVSDLGHLGWRQIPGPRAALTPKTGLGWIQGARGQWTSKRSTNLNKESIEACERDVKLQILAVSAAAKSLQSCPTLCNPRDRSPPGSPIPGILQARTLEWVAISFSNAWKWKLKVKLLSRVRLLATPWTAAYQAPPSMGFSRQEYWSGVPLPSPWQSLVHFKLAWCLPRTLDPLDWKLLKRHLASESQWWRCPQQSVSPETTGPFRQDPEHSCFDRIGDFSGGGVQGKGKSQKTCALAQVCHSNL